MRAQPPKSRLVGCLLFAAVLSVALQSAFADTIYLKNGRTIRTETARVDGDEIVFQQFGTEVRIPAALVDRIVKDDETEVLVPSVPRDSAPMPAAPVTGESDARDQDAEQSDAEGTPSRDGREYWQSRVRAVYEEQAQLQASITEWRREERGFLFSKRSTETTRLKIEAAQERIQELDQKLEELRREARREGIPSGWLRVSRSVSS